MFAILWTGAFVSNIGTWMETLSVGILVTDATNQAIWTGLVAAAGFVPSAVLGPFGGALADRVPRRRLLLITTAIQTIFAGTLTALAATGQTRPGLVTLIVFGAGCTQAIGFPAYQAVLPDLVPKEDLIGAVALSSAQWNLGRVVGPALAGDRHQRRWLHVGVRHQHAQLLRGDLRGRPAPDPPSRSSAAPSRCSRRSEKASPTRVVIPGLRVVVAYMAVNTLLAAPFIALIPAMAEKVFDSGRGRHCRARHRTGSRSGHDGVDARRARGALRTEPRAARRPLGTPARARRVRAHAGARALGPRDLLRRACSTSVRSRASRASPSSGRRRRCAGAC